MLRTFRPGGRLVPASSVCSTGCAFLLVSGRKSPTGTSSRPGQKRAFASVQLLYILLGPPNKTTLTILQVHHSLSTPHPQGQGVELDMLHSLPHFILAATPVEEVSSFLLCRLGLEASNNLLHQQSWDLDPGMGRAGS